MELFLESANPSEIKEIMSYGILDGIYTSAVLIDKEIQTLKAAGKIISVHEFLKQLLAIAGQDRTVLVQLAANSAADFVLQAKTIFNTLNPIAENVILSIPLSNINNLQAVKLLSDQEIPINITNIYTLTQALLAANAGASYITISTGNFEDFLKQKAGITAPANAYYPQDGLFPQNAEDPIEDNGIVSAADLIEKIADLFDKHEIECNLLASSLRNPRQVGEIALSQADIGAMPYAVLKALAHHPSSGKVSQIPVEYNTLFSQSNVPTQSTTNHQPATNNNL